MKTSFILRWFGRTGRHIALLALQVSLACSPGLGAPRPMVYVGRSHGCSLSAHKEFHYGLLAREIVRQSLLLTVREQFGLTTRDAWLEEATPAESAVVRLDVAVSGGGAPLMEILRGSEPTQEVVWSHELHYEQNHSPFPFDRLLAEVELLTRTELADELRKFVPQNFVPAIAPHERLANRSLPPLPERAEKLLNRMDVASQFLAVRTLHAYVRRDGVSPALWGGLVRGYANLGLLTELYWHPMHDVFKARSLLYAQQLVATEATSTALWHRAYAFALAGLDNPALADVAAGGKAAGGAKPPAWATLVPAYLHYDTQTLAEIEPKQAEYELAVLLRYVALERGLIPSLIKEAAEQVSHEMPSCRRALEGLQMLRCNENSKFVGREGWAPPPPLDSAIYGQVAEMPALPSSVAEVAKEPGSSPAGLPQEFAHRDRLIRALRAADTTARQADGTGGDAWEMSWPVLGRMLLEASFLELLPAHLIENPLRDKHPGEIDRLLADHPYHQMALNYSTNTMAAEPAKALMAAIDVDAIENQEWMMQSAFYQLTADYVGWYSRLLLVRRNETTGALANGLNLIRPTKDDARRLLTLSPYAPWARAMLIREDWDRVKQFAESWEREAASQPQVLYALGLHYLREKKFEDAKRCLEASDRLHHAVQTQVALADIYKLQGDTNRWIELVEQAAAESKDPVEARTLLVLIAEKLVSQHQWARAGGYIDAATQLGSPKALSLAAMGYEALQDWEKAEQAEKLMAQTEPWVSFNWYFWCKRVGQGDVREAERVARYFVENSPRMMAEYPNNKYNFMVKSIPGTFYILQNDLPKARLYFETDFFATHDVTVGLFATIIADQQDDPKRRDILLAELREKTSSASRKRSEQLCKLADLLAQDLSLGGKAAFDWNEVEKLRLAARPDDRQRFGYFLGAYLDHHGQHDQAVKYFLHCMREFPLNSLARTLAGNALCGRGILPAEYRADLLAPLK